MEGLGGVLLLIINVFIDDFKFFELGGIKMYSCLEIY